jgi:hypothetical protein
MIKIRYLIILCISKCFINLNFSPEIDKKRKIYVFIYIFKGNQGLTVVMNFSLIYIRHF